MSVVSIVAKVECDDCGYRFRVHLDAAYKPPDGWSIWDVVVDLVRGGVGDENSGAEYLPRRAVEHFGLTPGRRDAVVSVARTVAALRARGTAAADSLRITIDQCDVAEAVQLGTLEMEGKAK